MGAVQDVYDYLEAQGIAGGSTEWDIIRRRGMDAPTEDQLVTITEDGGPPPEIAETAGIGDSALQDVGVHVMVRAAQWDSDVSLAKAVEIQAELHGKRGITIGSKTYMRVRAQTPEPVFLGFDDRGRPRYTIAFLLLSAQ